MMSCSCLLKEGLLLRVANVGRGLALCGTTFQYMHAWMSGGYMRPPLLCILFLATLSWASMQQVCVPSGLSFLRVIVYGGPTAYWSFGHSLAAARLHSLAVALRSFTLQTLCCNRCLDVWWLLLWPLCICSLFNGNFV